MDRTKKTTLAIWVTLLICYALYAHSQGLGPLDSLRSLADFMTTSAWAIPVFIVLFTIRPVTLFSSALMAVAGGAFFGVFWGTVATIVGANLGGAWSYWAAYAFSSDDGRLHGPLSKLEPYADELRQRGFQSVLFLHLIHLPYDIITYACGYLRVNFKEFMLATLVGTFPGFLSLIVAGASSGLSEGSLDMEPGLVIASAVILCLTLGLAEIARRKILRSSSSPAAY